MLEDALRARNLPYTVVGGTRFFDRAEIKDLVAYMRAVANPDDGIALQRIINVPARGIGAATVDRIGDIIYERKIPAWQALELVAQDEHAARRRGPRKKVAAFVALMARLRSEGARWGPRRWPRRSWRRAATATRWPARRRWRRKGRIENLLELVAQMREYEREAEEPSLHGFLERIALVSDVDGYDADKGAISLMTVHTAKGLEFPVVFITGLEERIFPHARSVDDDSAVEEERRLCYVAVTRARKQLYLSRVRRRRLSGQELPGVPSRFLRDLPAGRVEAIVMARPPEYGGAYGDSEGRGPWGGRWSRDEPAADGVAHRRRRRRGAPRRGRAARGATPGEIRVEYDDDEQAGGLQVGAKLRHPSFGVGEVRGWQGAGNDMKVTMRFPGVGVKTILARVLCAAVAPRATLRSRPNANRIRKSRTNSGLTAAGNSEASPWQKIRRRFGVRLAARADWGDDFRHAPTVFVAAHPCYRLRGYRALGRGRWR